MSQLFERILLLKQTDFFCYLHTEDLKWVAESLQEERYYAGDRVFEIDDYGDFMYVIQQGQIGLSLLGTTAQDASCQPEIILSEGECFGEMNLLDDLPRSASAHVLEDSILLSLEKSRLKTLIVNYPQLGLGMLKALSFRIRQANSNKKEK